LALIAPGEVQARILGVLLRETKFSQGALQAAAPRGSDLRTGWPHRSCTHGNPI